MNRHATPEPFREACGLDGPLRLSVERLDGGPAEVRELAAPYAVIGRDAGADLVLDDPGVSRRHAYLQVVAGRAFVLDLGSRAGLSWGGDRRAEGWVDATTAVRVGPFLVRPLRDDPGAATGPLPEPTSRAFPMPGAADVLLEIEGPDAGPEDWQVSRTLVLLGRSAACRVRLSGPEVSSLHAALVRTAAGAWLVDLLSAGGSTVNGEAVRSARLGDGDEVRVGPHRITARLGARGLPAPMGGRGLATVEASSIVARAEPSSGALQASVAEEFARMQGLMTDQFQQALLAMFGLFGAMHRDQMALLREEMARLRELDDEQRELQRRLDSLAPPASASATRLRLVATESPADDRDRLAARRAEASDAPRPRPSLESADRAATPRPPDVHLMIEQRLAAIRGESQGRLQKLLGSMLGKGPDRASL